MLHRLWIRAISWLVPVSLRERWREEWLAELHAGRAIDWRALGALRDAWSTRAHVGPHRHSSGFTLAHLGDDIRFGTRQLRRHPAVSVMAMAIIALGTGFTAVVCSVVYSVFFKPWPVHEPDRIAVVFMNQPSGFRLQAHLLGRQSGVIVDPARDIAGVQAISGSWGRPLNIQVGDVTQALFGEVTTHSYFDVLGVPPALGRVFTPEEDTTANPEWAIVLSHRMWQQYFKGAMDVIGRTVTVNKRPATVIGVMPEGFHGVADIWQPSQWWMLREQVQPYGAIGTLIRLKSEATLATVQGSLDVIGKEEIDRIRHRTPSWTLPPGVPRYQIERLSDHRIPQFPDNITVPERIATALVAVVLAVLIIAIINIASLLAARGLTRAPELATRRVLGVTSFRLGRQLVTESLLLSAAGTALGLLLASNLAGAFTALTPSRYPIDAVIDWRIVTLIAGLGAAIAVMVSLLPIRQALRANVVRVLASGGQGAASDRRLGRYTIVVPQLALALLVLVAAGVHVRALSTIESDDRGYIVDGVTVFSMHRDTPEARERVRVDQTALAENYQRVYRSIYEVMRSEPAVRAALTASLPTRSTMSPDRAAAEGSDPQSGATTVDVLRTSVSPGAFDALGIRLIDGRDFDDRDTRQARAVTIVSEAIARRMWPGQSAIGRRIGVFSPQQSEPRTEWYEVIGVAANTRAVLPTPYDPPVMYTSLGQAWEPWAYNLVVGAGAGTEAINRLRARLDAVDAQTSVVNARPFSAVVDDLLYPRRLAATVLTTAGLVGVVLACIGLYGVIAFSVARRMRELGIRAALGASPGDLVSLVLGEGGRAYVIGAALGLGGAVMALRATAHIADGVPTTDWLVFVLVPLSLLAAVVVACWPSARRAARVDPAQTLRM